jgi:GMP synthase-like glutamine amidotransferase
MNLVRIPVKGVQTSTGYNAKNIVDLDDPGQATFWQSTPPGDPNQWVVFDLGKRWKVSRIWMLSNPSWPDGNVGDGWLKDFAWEVSDDLSTWKDITGANVSDNNTFRNILRFEPVEARYLGLHIKAWHGYAPQINAITLYSPGMPRVPQVPDKDYVLVVGNQQNGFTFTELAQFIQGLGLNLATVTVPHYEVSLDMVKNLKRKPVAIVLSGSNANYANLPMFEFNGEFELIRQADVPILGICCGHQMTALAYGYTNVRAMGWSDISSMRLKDPTEIRIVKKDPIFKGMQTPFVAAEVHSWAVARLPKHYEVIAESTYVQCLKSTAKDLYGEQFHAEIKVPYNQGKPYLVNFLKMAIEKARK